MDLNNLASYERLTGQAFFLPDDAPGGSINFGNIIAIKNSYNPKTVEMPYNSKGKQTLARMDTYYAPQVFTLEGTQFTTPLIELVLMGDRLADFSQSVETAQTFNITAKLGMAYWVGAYKISNLVVKVGMATKVLNTDYFADLDTGYIWFPVTAAGIAADAAVVATFDQPALTMEEYSALTKLNRSGQLTIFLEDEYDDLAKEIWLAQGQITAKQAPDAADATKFRQYSLELSCFGNPTVRKRPN